MSPKGLFNFEGGCYAKVIASRSRRRPEIYRTVGRSGRCSKNVVSIPRRGAQSFDDASLTSNMHAPATQSDFIPNVRPDGVAVTRNVLMLTAGRFARSDTDAG